MSDSQFDQSLRERLVFDIASKGDGMTIVTGDVRNERIEFRLPSRSNDNLRARSGKEFCCGMANPGTCPGHDGNFAVQCSHFLELPFLWL